ncbi:putative leucine-rich repeat-containing protein DDB_G0290503 [Onthophagus taurus]|uniref:putative leucine-rich repeat-containing protein DDB_G0290503 n=1 Tax=Onthophagus taurus TaxID=166361 RepID=UPI0039BECB32
MDFRLIFVAFVVLSGVSARPVSNEDIRDAILSIVNMIRATEDKLERHEYRERILGDQVKKSFISLEKRIRGLDQGVLSRLDERVATLESVWIQKDEKERIQLQKTFDAVEDIQKNLPNIVEKLKTDIIAEIRNKPEPINVDNTPKFDEIKDVISGKIDAFSVKMKDVGDAINKIKLEMNDVKINHSKVNELHQQSNQNLDNVEKHLKKNENVLEKFENKLAEYNNRVDVFPQIQAQNDYSRNIIQALESQKTNVQEILSEVKTLTTKINKIPDKTDLENHQNSSINHLNHLKHDLINNLNQSDDETTTKIDSIQSKLSENHLINENSFKEVSNMILSLTENVATSYNQLKTEVHSLNKLEQVMVQTADGVMDTKRRVEYGVHQILLEVGDLVKAQSKIVNNTMNEIFSRFELSVLDEETGALANLTTKIGDEIAQVWRQIGIMHQQMSASSDTLNKLQNQTDFYVNGSLNVMDNMKGKVGKITDRITELDGNLNYLLGRLSLVTQDFSMVKKGLGQALSEIRASFQEVQEKVKDNGPGPHKIQNESEENQPVI